jgi:hypothetical protein
MLEEGYRCLDMQPTESRPTRTLDNSRLCDTFIRIRLPHSLYRKIGRARIGKESLSAATRRILEDGLSMGGRRGSH